MAEYDARVLEAAPDAMPIADGAGRVVLFNAQVEKLFGCSRRNGVLPTRGAP